MFDLGHVRPPQGAPSRTLAWPVSLWRVEVTGPSRPALPDPFVSFLLDAAQAGPLDVSRLARLSGLPKEFLEDRLEDAKRQGWISSQLDITSAGESARLASPEESSRKGWMVECRRTGQMLPAFFETYPRGAGYKEEPLRIPAFEGLDASPIAKELGVMRAWRDHQRRQSAEEEREERGGTDLPLLEVSDEEFVDTQRSSVDSSLRKGPRRVRLLGQPQWMEARLDLWVEVEAQLPESYAIQIFAGCPVGWKRGGARYLRLLERIPEGQAAIAALRLEGSERYRERMSEAVDHRWAERLAEAQAEARQGLGTLPRLLERELQDLVMQCVRSTLGRDRLRGPLGQCRVVAEQLLIALMDDAQLVEEARAAWASQSLPSNTAAGRYLLARVRALLPEDDEGHGFELPKPLRGELERWAKSPPFDNGRTHGTMLLLHPFLLAALAPQNPAALRLVAVLRRERHMVELIRAVFDASNPSHHAGTRDEQEADQRQRLTDASALLRRLLLACFPVELMSTPTSVVVERPLTKEIYDDQQF